MIMTQEDKELLLKDLCARLPYGVKVQNELGKINKLVIGNADLNRLYYNDFSIYSEKNLSLPYLRPMSSMTEEQSKEYHELISGMFGTSALINFEILEDFFHKNHFDYRGLIKKGLAIDATRLNIYD